jgi:energy-coupling factor transporter ATP-binding protein EcfA2
MSLLTISVHTSLPAHSVSVDLSVFLFFLSRTIDMESIDSLAKAINKFEGGMVLVSHDMRLISQVAREIWVVDNSTVMKYVGEISDFKMQVLSLDHPPRSCFF